MPVQQTLKAGTIVYVDGIPMMLVTATQVEVKPADLIKLEATDQK